MHKLIAILIGLSLFCAACDKDNLDTDSNLNILFSADTIHFDTLITGTISTTKQLKIYNKSNRDIKISELKTHQINSPYQLNINGVNSRRFTDIIINSNDSLFVFIGVNLPDKNRTSARLISDKIELKLNNTQRNIPLETYALDVIRIDKNITKNCVWHRGKPYLITKDITVDKDAQLTIESGTMVLFDRNIGLNIEGSLQAIGTFQAPIIFRESRFDKQYCNIPAQWKGLSFTRSEHHQLKHFILRNSKYGLKITNESPWFPLLELAYGYISNCSKNAIFIKNSHIKMHDMLITNCGNSILASKGEGNIEVYQSTFYNHWAFGHRAVPCINITNKGRFIMGNTIVWGNNQNEIKLYDIKATAITNSLIKISLSNKKKYQTICKDCIFNANPLFKNIAKKDFKLQEKSPCIGSGSKTIAVEYPINFEGKNRTPINIGCY